jgi:hypothetical protein
LLIAFIQDHALPVHFLGFIPLPPVNHDRLSSRERYKRILDDLASLLEELHEYVGTGARVVLTKANVCTQLVPILTAHKLPILNRGRTIPFPSTGQQNRFREPIRHVLGSAL